MNKYVSIGCLFLSMAACTSPPSTSSSIGEMGPIISVPIWAVAFPHEDGRGKVVVEDMTVDNDSGYIVVEVDGKPVTRLSHPFITYVPCALINPGLREITLERSGIRRNTVCPERFTFLANLQATRRYRLSRIGNLPVLVDAGVRKAW